MENNLIIMKINNIFTYISKFALLNLLWIILTLIGLVFFGIFPATSAIMNVYKKNNFRKSYREITLIVWQFYKSDFLNMNIYFLIYFVFGSVLYINYKILASNIFTNHIIIIVCFYLILIFYIGSIIWIVPLNINFKNSIIEQMKNSFIISVSKINHTFFTLIQLFLMGYISLNYPGIIIFFTFSFSIYLWNRQLTSTIIEITK